jgi:hypothetical protein
MRNSCHSNQFYDLPYTLLPTTMQTAVLILENEKFPKKLPV